MDGTDCAIRRLTSVGPGTVAVTLAAPADFDARPGQFVQVSRMIAGEPVTRHYTISSPRVGETFELTVGVDPEGDLSPWLADAEPGDTVTIDGPYGRVFYEDERSVACVASGPGNGPAIGVAERALLDGGESTVVYETDHSGNCLVHGRRLAALATAGASVSVCRPREGGRLSKLVASVPEETQLFAYGFQPFVDRVKAAIRSAGGDPYAAKIENFG